MTGALEGCRVLDLTGALGWMCGKVLADLGADVIKVEPPGGDPGRQQGPFVGGREDPDANLRWWFLNRGKRSVVLDLDSEAGQAALKRLASSADALIESFPPGWMKDRNLRYEDLSAYNASLVVTSITPFGQDGPYAGYAGPDLVIAALGGPLFLTGDPDRPPVRPSVPQYGLHAGVEAAVATLMAFFHAQRTGLGQHVDVSAQLCAIRTLMNATGYPALEGINLKRQGRYLAFGHGRFRLVQRCANGHVSFQLQGGATGARQAAAVFVWVEEEMGLPDWAKELDWSTLDFMELLKQGEEGALFFERVSDLVEELFSRYTKEELYEQALQRRLLLGPVNTVRDLRNDIQLESRNYFVPVDHEALGTVMYAGPWAKLSETPLVDTPRAPNIGEHTEALLAADAPRPPRATLFDGTDETIVSEHGPVLEGLKVWDMSWIGVGPVIGRYLADYGATVIRLDSSSRPDLLRMSPPFKDGVPGLNRSQFFADFNAGKLSVGLDMRKPEARDVAFRLASWADVVIESFTPKTMAAWGMAYKDLVKVNPSLVMLSTCMQGQTGPRALYPGYGSLMAAIAGFYEITGWSDRDPVPVFGAYTDFICPRFGAAAILAALYYRRRTGTGQYIDLSQLEAAAQFLGPELLDFEVNGAVATRRGNSSPFACPHGVYPCAGDESWIAIAVETEAEWSALKRAMGDPPWANNDRFATCPSRKDAEDELNVLLAEWTRTIAAQDLFRLLQPSVPAGPVHNQTDLHRDPQIAYRNYFVTLSHPEMGEVPYDGLQANLSRTPGKLRKAGPCQGEDTYQVLHDVLKLSDDEIGELIAVEAAEIGG